MRRPLVIGLVVVVALAVAVAGANLAIGDQPTTRPNDLARGEELYLRHCIQCHGAMNDGEGPASTSLVVPAPYLQGTIKSGDFDRLVPAVLDGKGTMPSFVLSFDKYDARRVIRYMALLGPHSEAKDGDEEGDEEGADDDAPDAPAADGPAADGPE